MTQQDRDRLVALKKARKGLITQRHVCAEEVGRQSGSPRRRGKPSNRKIEEGMEEKAVTILYMPVYKGFGPTLAAEYLGKKYGIDASSSGAYRWTASSCSGSR